MHDKISLVLVAWIQSTDHDKLVVRSNDSNQTTHAMPQEEQLNHTFKWVYKKLYYKEKLMTLDAGTVGKMSFLRAGRNIPRQSDLKFCRLIL